VAAPDALPTMIPESLDREKESTMSLSESAKPYYSIEELA
jgi:hypothetical protein